MNAEREHRFRPTVEALEDRTLPAVGISTDGTLVIRGTNGHDTASLNNYTDGLGRNWYKVVLNGARTYFRPWEVTNGRVYFGGYGGSDYFANNLTRALLRTRAFGDAGNDTLRGAAHTDSMWGGTGNDTLYGNGGGDYLYGEDHDDYIDGGSGNDWCQGGNHNDRIYGGSGGDTLFGQAGNDMLKGESESDQLVGGTGYDTLYGDAGNDSLWGEGHADQLSGGDGSDYLNGGIDGYSDGLYGDGPFGPYGADRFVWEDNGSGGNLEYVNDFGYGADSWV